MSEILHLFIQGGIVMYPLVLALLVAGTLMIERFSYYRRTYKEVSAFQQTLTSDTTWKSFCQDMAAESQPFCQNVNGVISAASCRNVLQSRLEDVTASMATNLQRGLDWLSTIVTMAPLLGLLGTVTGMIRSFQVFGSSNGAPTAITGGVGEALIATAFGLCVAIFALTIHAYFSHRMRHTLADIEQDFGRVLDLFDRRSI